MKNRILRLTQVMNKTGLSRSSIYAFIQQDRFPKPIKLGPKASGWLEADVQNWILEKIQASRGSHD